MPTELPIAGVAVAGASAVALSRRFNGRPLMWWGAASLLAQSVYHFLRSMKEHAFTGAALRAALREAGVPLRSFSPIGGPRELLVSLALPAPGLLAPWGMQRLATPYWRFRDGRASLDMEILYTPHAKGAPPRGVLLHFTSWSWALSSRRVGSRPLALQAAAAGWLVMLPRPRTIPSVVWPQPLTDAKRALAWCKLHCGIWGGDAHRVVVSGDSTGGHVALMLGLTANTPEFQRGTQGVDTSVAAMVAIHPVVDLTDSGDSMSQRDPSRSGFQLLQLLMRRRYARDRTAFVLASPLHQVLGAEHLWREQQRSQFAADAAATAAGAAGASNMSAAVTPAVLPGAFDIPGQRREGLGYAHRAVIAAQELLMHYVFGVPVCGRPAAAFGSTPDAALLQAGANTNAAATSTWGGGRAPVVPPLLTVTGGASAPTSRPYLSSIVRSTGVYRDGRGGYSRSPQPVLRALDGPLAPMATDQNDMQVQVPPLLHGARGSRGPMPGSLPAGSSSRHTRLNTTHHGDRTASGQLAMLRGATSSESLAAPAVGGLTGAAPPPCLLVHGSNDCVVPPEEALRFWHALRLRRAADGVKSPPQDCLMLIPGGGSFLFMHSVAPHPGDGKGCAALGRRSHNRTQA